MEGISQLLSLKVMRVSRPSLATAWEPFYSSSSSFSAHSTASIMSLQGSNPLPGHPKTLRDLTHVSEMLVLPSAFGAIQLGETFSGCLSVNNEATVDVEGVTLRAEMQTVTSKTLLVEYGGPDHRIAAGDTMENAVHHEIKELGQHVLACTVTYRLPQGYRSAQPTQQNQEPSIQSFRKFYKFAVTNPLSVKTKVHIPRSPTALLSPMEREKVFLEVHIQNLTSEPLWLQTMKFEPVDDWTAQDTNVMSRSSDVDVTMLSTGSMALLHPQDTRQYVYILSPKEIPAFPVTHAPGAIIPLGRLDISWRSGFGEPGRLLTSMLSRRIPLIQAPQPNAQPAIPPIKQPASALPLHLQRGSVTGTSTPPRVQSPQLGQRPMTPPIAGTGAALYRPGSPLRTRTNTVMSLPSHAQTPSLPFIPFNPALRRSDESVDAYLTIRYLPRDEIVVQTPFRIHFTLSVTAPIPPSHPPKQRILTIAIQHVQSLPRIRPPPPPSAPSASNASNADMLSPRLALSPGFSTPSPYNTPSRADFPESLAQRLLVASPRETLIEFDLQSNADTTDDRDTAQGTPGPQVARSDLGVIQLPPPFAVPEPGEPVACSKDVIFVGSSAVLLPQIRLTSPPGDSSTHGHGRTVSESTASSEADSDLHTTVTASLPRGLASQDFGLEFLPLRSGFATVGGIRVLLVEDRQVDADDDSNDVQSNRFSEVRTLREWDVVAEIWVKGASEANLVQV